MKRWMAGVGVLVTVLLASAQANAKQGGLCYSKAFHPQAQLTCDHIGEVSMSEIYAKGWRVTAVWTYSVGANVITYFAIEEQ